MIRHDYVSNPGLDATVCYVQLNISAHDWFDPTNEPTSEP